MSQPFHCPSSTSNAWSLPRRLWIYIIHLECRLLEDVAPFILAFLIPNACVVRADLADIADDAVLATETGGEPVTRVLRLVQCLEAVLDIV